MKITVSRAAPLKEKKVGKCHQDEQEGCQCEMMDISLSQISDSDCTCSDCLEANLEAFNQIEKTQFAEPLRHNSVQKATVKPNGVKLNERPLSQKHSTVGNIQTNSFNRTKKAYVSQKSPSHAVEVPLQNESEQGDSVEKWDIQQFILLTRNRTRKYIEERKKLEGGEQYMKQQLKIKIKENLQNLKYSSSLLPRKDGKDQPLKHPYKWNHKPSQNCTRQKEEKRKPRQIPKIDTNLKEIIPNFEGKRQDMLQQIKNERIAKIEKQQTAKCLDLCINHPTKSDPNKMKKIEAMIRKNVEKLKEKNRMHRLKKQQAKKLKQAKLRAIDIKCKQLLTRAKKYDANDLRSSFHASVDHFSTFSELRDANNVRKSQKQLRKRAETQLNQEAAERAIFENLQGEDQEPRKEAQKPTEVDLENKDKPIQSKGKHSLTKIHQQRNKDALNSVQKKAVKQREVQSIQEEKKTNKSKPVSGQIARSAIDVSRKEGLVHKDIFDEFVKDTLIKPPKKIKQEDKTEHRKKESKNKLNAKDEQAKKKRLALQIEKKKSEIVSQYKKQNAVAQNIESRNKRLREQYENKVAAKKIVSEIAEQVKPPRDLYRSKYEIQPEGDIQKMTIHGDPLMHEHEREAKIRKAKKAGEKDVEDIFTADLKTLLGRAQLKF